MGYPALDAAQQSRLGEMRERVGRLGECVEEHFRRLNPQRQMLRDMEVLPDTDQVIFHFWEWANLLGYTDPVLFMAVVTEVVEPLLFAQLSRVLVDLGKLDGRNLRGTQ